MVCCWLQAAGGCAQHAEAETVFDPAARQQLLDVAHLYEILVASLEMLPPEEP
jgi:hypothetical protein